MAVSAMSKQQVFVVHRLPSIKSIGAVMVNHHIVLHPLCKVLYLVPFARSFCRVL